MSECFYDVLGLDRSSSDNDIKRAYHKLALRWHPDKNLDNVAKADKMFKLIAEAYDVLSDTKKRSVYDQYGKEGLKAGAQGGRGGDFHFHFASASDIFNHFFGTSDPFNVPFDQFDGGRSRMNNFGSGAMFTDFGGGFGHGGGGGGFGHGGGGGGYGHGGMGGGMDGGMGGGGFTDMGGGFGFSSFSSNSFGGGNAFSKTTSRSRTCVNGKSMETTTTVENGIKTVEMKEDGKLVSRKVNGKELLRLT